MKQKTDKKLSIIAGSLVIAGFLLGVIHLFSLRFQSGDLYPPYSSYRTDPLGTKALYEALSEIDGITVERNHDYLGDLKLDPDTVILFLGDTLKEYDQASCSMIREMNMFIGRGGRLVVTLLPRNYEKNVPGVEADSKDAEDDAANDDPDNKADPEEMSDNDNNKTVDSGEVPEEEKVGWEDLEDEDTEELKYMTVSDWLGVVVGDVGLTGEAWATIVNEPAGWTGLPERVSCHTSIFLTDDPDGLKESDADLEALVIGGSWNVVYERDGNPVVVEKKYGRGSIVLSALTYFVSNEAMREERYVPLISWLIGEHGRVIFDEYHHGVVARRGVMDLARKYRLQWFLTGLLFLGVLFVWKSSSSLVPPVSQEGVSGRTAYAEGKDSFSGLVNLLRRNIAPATLLKESLKEFKKSVKTADRETSRRLEDMENEVETVSPGALDEKKLVSQYNRLAGIWKEKRRYHEH